MILKLSSFSLATMALPSIILAASKNIGPSSEDSRLTAAEICDPVVAEPQSYDDMLPCAKARHIEEFLCRPNGTNPTDLEGHVQCMCKGDFFGEKLACDTCTRDNGGIDTLELALYDSLLHDAYDQLCLATASLARDAAVMPTAVPTTFHGFRATEAIPTSTLDITTTVQAQISHQSTNTPKPTLIIGSHTLTAPKLTDFNSPLMTAPWPPPQPTATGTNQTKFSGNIERVGDNNMSPNHAGSMQVSLASLIMALVVGIML
ncbi:hypothetical protein BN1723_004987 [Verticillium longisporum]|uniref:Uncharacterized protein n=1 Tax=Verticillium longisporum TaxID=100787 RepID=A0A0G4N358_VERLO|nr:hypothetical protein BN1723_004987 [Verticillium longisporum]